MFVSSWAGNQFSPLLLMYEGRAHYSSAMVTLFLGVYVVGLVPALLIAGSLCDRHGRRPLMLAGLVSGLIGSGLLALGGLGAGFLMTGRLFSGFTVGIAMAVGNSWIKELSAGADSAAGARRASLAFTLGSGTGAVVAGLIAQWGPIPEVMPFAIHILLTLPVIVIAAGSPESHTTGGVPGPWYRQLAIPSAAHRRFTHVVVVAAPWTFAGAAISYGYLPTRLDTGSWGMVYATACGAVALGVSSLVQPLAKRVHSLESARGLCTAVFLMTLGLALVWAAVEAQSIWLGLGANVVVGLAIGIALVSGLLEVQRIAGSRDLAGLTGVFYAAAYLGFLAPTVMAAVAVHVSVGVILGVVVALAALAWLWLVTFSRRHLPA